MRYGRLLTSFGVFLGVWFVLLQVQLARMAEEPEQQRSVSGKVNLWPGIKSGTPLTDQEFFSSLNLELPALKNVKSRVDATDWKGAREEFYRYIREKFRKANYYALPKIENGEVSLSDSWLNDDLLNFWIEEGRKIHHLGSDEENLLAIAADFADKGRIIFHSTGHIYEFDPTKPFNYADFDPHNREYHESLQMYALYDISLLRYAHFKTGKQIYLERAEQMMASFCDWFGGGASGPYGDESHRKDGNPTHPWESWTLPRRLEAYVRFFTFLQKADMDPDLVTATMKEVLQDERLHVSRTWGRGNWGQYMATDGGLVAAVFFEFKEAGGWWDSQLQRLAEGTADILPDGSTPDASPSYGEAYVHWMQPLSDAIKAFASPMRMDIPPNVAARYEGLFDWELAMRKPDGRDIQVSDTGASRPPEWYGKMAGKLFDYFGRADLRWFASGGKEGHAPLYSSFPPTSSTPSYAGFYVMRSDWSKQARYLVVHFGPSHGHGHPDYGSFILNAYGADLIDEGGCAAYGSEAYNKYSRRPWAHNIVGIDDFNQENKTGGRLLVGQPLYDWITNSAYDYTWGSYLVDAVGAGLRGITWDRAVYFVKPDYFLLLDRISGEGTHKIRSKLQLSWDVGAEVQGSSVTARSERGASLRIVPFDGRTAPVIIRGQKEPFWDGWISKIPHSNLVEAAPSVVYEESRGLPVSYETLLYPVRAGENAEVDVSEIPSDAGSKGGVLLTVRAADRSFRDEIVVSDASGLVKFAFPRLSVEGRLVHLRYEGTELRRIAFVKTWSVSLPVGGKQTTIRFALPLDGYIEVGADGTLQRIYLDLSTRRDTESVVIDTPGKNPVRKNVPIGKETML